MLSWRCCASPRQVPTGEAFGSSWPDSYSPSPSHTSTKDSSLVESIDVDAAERLGAVCSIAPSLALDLVDDGMARAHPRFYDRLLGKGVAMLAMPDLPDPLSVARALVRAADVSDRTRGLVADALRDGLAGGDVSRATTLKVQACLGQAAHEAGVGSRAKGLGAIRREVPTLPRPPTATPGELTKRSSRPCLRQKDLWQKYSMAPTAQSGELTGRAKPRTLRLLSTRPYAIRSSPPSWRWHCGKSQAPILTSSR